VTRVLLCSGKIYYELAKRRADGDLDQVALVRVEQLYPFPAAALRAQLDAYPDAERVLWVQEEPENMGAWRYVRLKAEQELGVRLELAGRAEGAAPAAGSPTLHAQEQQELLDRAFAGL
jgi:2-oxoglutarate dehydrogenase E1 component